MRILKTNTCVLLFCLSTLLASTAFADSLHYVNVLVGDRASGLAGAYTAISDDPAGCFYNPAGIAFAPTLSLSASVNAFSMSTKTYEGVLTGTDGSSIDWEQVSSSLLPNFFGVVRKFGKGMVGLSYAVPDSLHARQKQYFQNLASSYPDNPIDSLLVNINDNDRTYLVGPSYAYAVSDSLSFGTTLYACFRDREIIRNFTLQFSQGEHILKNFYETRQEWGVQPILGVVWEPLDRLAVGLSVAKTFVVSSDTQNQMIYRNTSLSEPEIIDGMEYDFSDTDTIYFKSDSSSDEEEYPFSAALGLAYFVSPRLLFSGDVKYYQAISEKEAVVNIFLGSEYYFSDSMAVRGGLFTDRTNTPELSAGSTDQLDHADIYGASLSITRYQRSSNITLGASYGLGSGEGQAIEGSTEIQDVKIENLNFYISASYSY